MVLEYQAETINRPYLHLTYRVVQFMGYKYDNIINKQAAYVYRRQVGYSDVIKAHYLNTYQANE